MFQCSIGIISYLEDKILQTGSHTAKDTKYNLMPVKKNILGRYIKKYG